MEHDDIDDAEEELLFKAAVEALDNIKKRCDACKMVYEDLSQFADSDFYLEIRFPCGPETRFMPLVDGNDLIKFNAIPFEKYVCLSNYAAIASYEDGTIEAVISAPMTPPGPLSRNRLRNALGVTRKGIQSSTLTLTSGEGDNVLTINIRNASQEARILVPATSSLGLSIEITNAKVKQHDEAVDLLQQIANSLFFSIDLQKGTYLSLIRNPSRERRDRPHANDLEIHFPRHVYDKAPMDLYWYARSATNMPLLQFLAYYQVLEYYYPVFFNADISRRIRAQIKNPAFRVDSESDISRVVSTIKTKGPGSGSEREQLKATLRECIENDDIHDFVNQSPQRAAFFNSKAKGITANLLNTANKTTELYIQAAERIYSIRCKIVHTKSDDHEGEIELLLPYSKEAEKLGEDIELVKFVAQKVMVYSSKEVPIV